MKFEEAWHWLRLTGFKNFPYSTFWHNSKLNKSHKHHRADLSFKDTIHDFFTAGWSKPPIRDNSIKIEAPKKCNRCGRRGRLERDHIIALNYGGLDVAENLQYLCHICHRYKTTRDAILHAIMQEEKEFEKSLASTFREEAWQVKMWKARLEALDRLNPVGASHYTTYWKDPMTHYQYWYYRNVRKKPKEPARMMTLDAFGRM